MTAQAVTRVEPEVPAISETAAIVQMIERAAMNPAVDIDKMERLLEMQERVMSRRAEAAFNEAMTAAQAEAPQVTRDAENSHTKSLYARLETINAAIVPIITKNGFSLSFGTADSPLPNHYRVVCTCAHRDGHSRIYHADLPADTAGSQGKANKTPIQGFGSTMSYGRRYLTLMIFNVSLKMEDDDGEAAGLSEAVTEEQLTTLREKIEATNADIEKFCRFFKIESLPELPAPRFAEAIRMLDGKQRSARR
jgi:hypothetical protein